MSYWGANAAVEDPCTSARGRCLLKRLAQLITEERGHPRLAGQGPDNQGHRGPGSSTLSFGFDKNKRRFYTSELKKVKELIT